MILISNADELLNYIIVNGCYAGNEYQRMLNELEEKTLIIRCDRIPHNKNMLNPSYTWVTNDDDGKEWALKYALGTICV